MKRILVIGSGGAGKSTFAKKLIKYIWDYPRTRKPAVLKKIGSCSETKKVAILRSQADIDGFLAKARN